MGIDEETERPAVPAAADAAEAGQSSTQVADPDSPADHAGEPEPGTEGHSEEWLANASKAAEKIRAMFKS